MMAFALISADGQSKYIARLKRGDQAAWRELVAAWSPTLYSYVYWNVPTHVIQPLLIQVWQTAVRSIALYDDRIDIAPWLYTITHQRILDWQHEHREYRFHVLHTESDHTQRWMLRLADLPEQVRTAVLLHHREGLSVEAVAEVLGRTVRATRELLNQAQRLLATAPTPETRYEPH